MKIPIPKGATEVDLSFNNIVTEPPVNQLPESNAGPNQTLKLPINSTKLSGTAIDNDGKIATVLWELVSGTGKIESPTSYNTNVTGLTEGTTIFRFHVTDDHGAKNSDDVSIIVQKAEVTPPPGNYGTLVYENAYSKESDINSNQLGEGGFATIGGKGAFKSLVTGKVSSSGSFRSEQQFDGSLYNPNEFVLEYDANYENWKNFGNNSGHVVQWHPHGNGLSATLSIYGYQGEFEVVRNLSGTNYREGSYPQGKKKITPNVFITHRWEVKWSTGNDGYIRLYLDNVLYYSYTGKTKFESQNPYYKQGQNRWIVSGGNSTIYYRNLKIWKR